MKKFESDLILPPDFRRIHFVKVESAAKDDSIHYVLKNHFNAPILEVEGKQNGSQVDMDFVEPPARAGKTKQENPLAAALFRASITKLESSYIFQSDASPSLVCNLLSMEGKRLFHIIAAKDKSSSTHYDYKALKSAKKREALFQLNRRQAGVGQSELTVGLLTGNNSTSLEGVIARINFNEGSVCLSMAPELEILTKARLICIAIFLEILENRQLVGIS